MDPSCLLLILSLFWNSWIKDCLVGLCEYLKSILKNSQWQISDGEVVLMEDNCPRNRWKMAVVIELRKGRDGEIRGCKLRANSRKLKPSYLTRPINKVPSLEIRSKIGGVLGYIGNL